METITPYAPPETHAPGAGASETKKRQWLRHPAVAFFLFPVWFVIGGAISIGGSKIQGDIDALGFVVLFGYAEFPSSPESSA